MTATLMNALHGPLAHALKKPGVVTYPLVECIAIVQSASVPIQEI